MKRESILLTAATLLLALGVGSCKKESAIVGRLWQWQSTEALYGETDVQASVRLIASTESSGMLFVCAEMDGEVWNMAAACPFTYTTSGDGGTMTVDGSNNPTGSAKVKWSYDKAGKQLHLELGALADLLDNAVDNITLTEAPKYDAASMSGTSWTADMSEGEGDLYTIGFEFTDNSHGKLSIDYLTDDDVEHESYNFDYSYAAGLGQFTYTMFGSKNIGGFYLTDKDKMLLSDGMNMIMMQRK